MHPKQPALTFLYLQNRPRRAGLLLRQLLPALFLLFFSPVAWTQSTGFINRAATVPAGRTILDPNGDGYTSQTAAGYAGDDVNNSEIPYRPLPSFAEEPYGDLRRGPDHRFSDFVPDANKRGYYTYFTGTEMLFRFRMGSIMSGSKGYSVLMDTDGKFGDAGPDADPNFQAETTGTNGNPGFEIEIVLETNFRLAIYNVDGTSNPVLVKAYNNWQDLSQISVAGTFDNGDPDFFIDCYIPFSDLQAAPFNLTATTPLRMAATTVMAPKGAIGGPKSDIYGMNDDNYKSASSQYINYIKLQPPFTPTDIKNTGVGAVCTEAPLVNAPIGSGTVTISGTWTKSALAGAGTADITVFRNGLPVGTINGISSGTSWSLPNVALANGDVVTAKAQASGESMCLSSNSVTAMGCNPSTIPSTTGFTITCSSDRGIEGSFAGTNQVKLYKIDPVTLATTLIAGPADNTPRFGYSGSNWFYNDDTHNGNNIPAACSGGQRDMDDAVYFVTTVAAGGTCESAPLFTCIGLAGTTATPTITQASLLPSSTTVSGTATTGAQVRLYVNGQLRSTATAVAGAYSFTGLLFNANDAVAVYAIATNSCVSAAVTRSVTCNTSAPLINVDNNNQLKGGQPITGISDEPAGTTIRVYTSGNSLVSTVTVQGNGTWTTGAFNAVAGTTYYATAQNGSCGLSVASGNAAAVAATTNRCGTITGPVSAGDAAVSGTLTGSVAGTVVTLYIDGTAAGSVTTGNTAWSIPAASLTQPLYANAILTIGVRESGRAELLCSNTVSVACTGGPAAPIVSPSSSTIYPGYSQTYTISNAVPGAFYGLADATTGMALGDGVWATSTTLTLTTYVFTTGTYNVVVKGTSLSGVTVCSSPSTSANVVVTNVNNTGDIDDDDDGIPDLQETGGFDPFGDADNDGTQNYLDPTPGGSLPAFVDTDNDGVNDYYDADRDGTINSLDLDSDNDGIPDLVEAGGVDTNGDGKVDNTTDTDGDGLRNAYDTDNGGTNIANLDTDGDGIVNMLDLDSDNDGIPDVIEVGAADANNDGRIDNITDMDMDGFIDSKDGDVGNDGTAENSINALITTSSDTNGDGRPENYPRNNVDRLGLPNPYDLDADGDGILDTREAGLADSNNDGIADGATGSDGWSDAVDALPALNLPNSEGRNARDFLDIDADDDGLTDNVEAQTTAGYSLPSGNDADNDGIDDSYDNNDAGFAGNANNGLTPNNHDGTDAPDYLDSDTDNDGVNDLVEGSGNLSATLTTLTDTDGDGLLDQFDTFNSVVETSNRQQNVTITGMGNGGSTAGPSPAGSNVTANQTMMGAANRDWRNTNFVLPVQLLQFGVQKDGARAWVKWETAQEAGMKEYVVERSIDGRHFEARATTTARGGTANSYRVADPLYNLSSGTVYYRLRQLASDGNLSYSAVVSLQLEAVPTLQLLVTPNPASGPVNLQVKSNQPGSASLTVHSANGKLVWARTLPVQQGTTSLHLDAERQLPNGTYVLTLTMEGQQLTQRFVVQR